MDRVDTALTQRRLGLLIGAPAFFNERRESMTQDVASEFKGVVVSWESTQDKYWKGAGVWTGTKQAKKLGEDLSLSDYQEAAKVHPDPKRREKFKNVAQWMKQQGATKDTRLSALL